MNAQGAPFADTKGPLALSPQQLTQLLEIEAANLIEQGGNSRANLEQLAGTAISEGAKKAIAECLARKASPAAAGG